jgi:hypothetical protein
MSPLLPVAVNINQDDAAISPVMAADIVLSGGGVNRKKAAEGWMAIAGGVAMIIAADEESGNSGRGEGDF